MNKTANSNFSIYSMLMVVLFAFISVGSQAQIDPREEAMEDKDKKKQEQQRKPRSGLRDRMIYGGNFDARFGNIITLINVSPMAAYKVTPDFFVGLGATYIYYRYRERGFFDINASIYGGRAFANHVVYDKFFAHIEYENLNVEQSNPVSRLPGEPETYREWVPAVLAGGGYREPISERAFFQITALYDLAHSSRSLYASPLRINFGFMVSF